MLFINSVRFILQENHHEITANKLPYYSNLRMPSLLMLQLPLYVIYFYIYIYEYIHKTRIPNQFSSEMIHFFFVIFYLHFWFITIFILICVCNLLRAAIYFMVMATGSHNNVHTSAAVHDGGAWMLIDNVLCARRTARTNIDDDQNM